MSVPGKLLRLLSTVLTLGLFLAVLVAGPVVRGVTSQTQTATLTEQVAAAKKVRKGRIKVVLTGTGSYTIKRKGFRKTASTSKTFRVKPGRYRVKAPGATVNPRKVKVRAGRTVKVRVAFPAPAPMPTPAPPPPPTSPQINPDTITAGTNHTCGIDTTGKAWCWGYDSYGQVGDGDDGQGDEYAPVPVASALHFTVLTAGYMHTCGIDSTGRAWCWGDDSVGQVGDGNDSQTTEFAPVQVADNHTFTRLTAGAYHTCGIDTTGKAWCWGIGDARLGNGAGGPPFEPAPTPVTTTVAFAHLSTGSEHTCGIDTTGKAWCWGNDHYGQVGDGNDDQGAESTPVHVAGTLNFTALSAGSMHTCAIDTTGRAWCWGTDYYGELGDGNDGQADEYSPRPVDNSLTFTRLTAAGQHTCGIDTAGKAWCWGSDHYGQLGDGNDSQADEYSPVPVATSLTFTHLTAAGVHSCGIDTAGKAWCWGSDGSGQLGDGNDDQADEYAPVPVTGDHTFATTY